MRRTQKTIHAGIIYLMALLAITTMADAQNVALSSTQPTLVHGALAAAAVNSLNNCSSIRSLFEAQGINGGDVPTQPSSGEFLYSIRAFSFFSYYGCEQVIAPFYFQSQKKEE